MRKSFALLFVAFFGIAAPIHAGLNWKRANLPAGRRENAGNGTRYLTYSIDESVLKGTLYGLQKGDRPYFVELPMPDGNMRTFAISYTPMMPDDLAARYPGIRTFSGVAADDPLVTVKLDYTLFGFHAMVFSRKGISFIDPAANDISGYYTVHDKKDEAMQYSDMPANCVVKHVEPVVMSGGTTIDKAAKTVNGYQLRTYRLALACSHQYAQAATSISSPTIAQVLSKMTTSMNRINGVYERELSVTMVFAAGEDQVIWNVETGGPNGPDPFSAIDNNATACLPANQAACDDRIGTANYDVGHVFTTNAGGYSLIGVICKPGEKAQSVTGQPHPTGDGFDIDYVAHEMGHEFGADHTFNNSHDGSCAGSFNINPPTAFEPGSGSTIMAYAGICSPDNIQLHSDDYFHAASLIQIQYCITSTGDVCAAKTSTGNKVVSLPPFKATYKIPILTPFELEAPAANDSVGSSSVSYCWEQWNLGDVGERLVNTHDAGPLFRSYKPSASPVRIFPRDTMVLRWETSDAGHNNSEGESLPDVARYMTFKLTMRNIYQGKGCVLIPDDSIRLDVINTGSAFKVTSQGDSTLTIVGNSLQNVTWDVVGTDAAPISASSVDIYMSEDGGYTWPHHIGTFPNTGSASIPFPNPDSTTTRARIKVKAKDNVFFNVNRYDFTVTHSDGTDTSIRIYPVPARTTLRISSGNKGQLQFRIYNTAGRLAYSGEVNGIYDVPVSFWPRGLYIIRMMDLHGEKTVRKFVLE